jgi:glycosyltransferase involved in cell wall biosynthesis
VRIAFITCGFPTEQADGGGLGHYLFRICRELLIVGHSPEVFVVSSVDERIEADGILVHRVDPSRRNRWAQRIVSATKWLPKGDFAIGCAAKLLPEAAALAAAFKRREREVAFDFVQSADFRAVGLFIPSRRDRPHIIRCSCAADLWSEADGHYGFNPWQCSWERFVIRRADRAYAPSRLVADHYYKKYGLDVGVVRPPFSSGDIDFCTDHQSRMRRKYLLHFGQLNDRKGTGFLADTLPLVWKEVPDFRMVWAGNGASGYLETLRVKWGEHAGQIEFTGRLAKSELYELLSQCQATVLPSLVDNLPNTVIESLIFDKPVVGTHGSSVDEIVEDGKNGWLVPFGDSRALANAILAAWRGSLSLTTGLIKLSPICDHMQPVAAIENLVQFAKSRGSCRDWK